MRYAIKLGLKIFILGVIVLFIALFAVYHGNYNSIINNEFQHTASVVNAISTNLEKLLAEKIKITKTLSITPILKEALEASNRSYRKLSEIRKNEKIHLQNEKWKTIKNEKDAFILEFTDNNAALFLKEQQNNIEGEYGEIFLTNKYGALVASTAKLTTFAHAHKYWWQGAFNNGEGTVFFVDRGYDDSVGGYVLGLVLPVKQGDEIIGILKVNLNILGAISTLILSPRHEHFGDFKLVRSGGEIIFEEGSEPLKNRVPDLLSEKLQFGDKQPFVFEDSENKWLIGMAEIGLTSGMKVFCFGGTFESIDHRKGNVGESWHIINYRKMTNVLKTLKNLTLITFFICVLLTIFLAFAALLLGNQTAKPLMQLIEQSKKIAKGKLGSRIIISRKDEIGYLSNAINNMAEELEKTTTSIVNLESEITVRKQAEEANVRLAKILQKAHDELEHRVKERTGELIKANEELAKADRLKDEFLTNMSHELRTPLNGILGYAQILKRGDLTARQKEGVDIIQNSGEHLLMLINEILNLSKIEAGRMELEQNEFYPADFLKNIADMIHIRAKQKGITFNYEPAADLPVRVRGDERKLSQILINLLGNAVKFTEKGGITFRISNLGLRKSPNRLIRFEIEDTGIGIPAENMEEMFLPFRQVGDRRYAVEGTGLGLAISNKLVRLMSGKLNVKSESGKGSVFQLDLDLPEVAGFVPQKEDTNIITGYQGKKRKILVADDIWENCMVMTNILQPLDFDILEAKDGLDCLEKARIFEPDVILLDMRMPVMNGFETTRQSRQIDSLKNAVIIAVTASAFKEDREKCLAAGCNDFIAKPINATELLELLRNHLNLEWIHEEKPDILQSDDAQILSMTLPAEDIDILLKLASRRSVKKLLQHLAKIEESDSKLLPLTEKIRRLARQFQLSEIVEYLVPERKSS